jgi:asparagine synthase (glutamine-hydrolysing)
VANFIAIVDPDEERRRRFLKRVRDGIAPLGGLRIDTVEVGDFAAVWAANDRAPISTAASGTEAAVIWGDAIPGPGPERVDAARLLQLWEGRDATPASFDGFHAAVRYNATHGLVAGADVLGLFPIYYAVRDNTLLVGSSPELFSKHPSFPARLSPEGLTGLLLAHAIVDGKALLSDARRLPPGYALTWNPGSEPVERLQYAIPIVAPSQRTSFREDVDALDAAFTDAMHRHVPHDEAAGILLSGGRDSRQLAGYLRARGGDIHALTLGCPTDYEVECAQAVARVLGADHRVVNVGAEACAWGATCQARWEHLAMGFSSIHTWGAIEPLRELPPRFVCGYLREICEGEPSRFVHDPFIEGAWKQRGIDAPTLERLLRPGMFSGQVERMGQRMRSAYTRGSTIEAQRPWRFSLSHEGRAHAGGVPWRLSFGSWPIVPILDRNVLEVMASLPQSSLGNRRAQDDILRRRFPDLARLPLDRNSHDTLPLLPSVGERIRHRVWRAAEPLRRRLPPPVERRYYHRMYDMNGAGWRAVRRLAEPHRERLADLFDMDELAKLVPPPDVPVVVRNTIGDTYGRKLLVGLMMWTADHLA